MYWINEVCMYINSIDYIICVIYITSFDYVRYVESDDCAIISFTRTKRVIGSRNNLIENGTCCLKLAAGRTSTGQGIIISAGTVGLQVTFITSVIQGFKCRCDGR